MVRVVVIGAGVIGLSTAINIQQSMPGAQVTIMADRFQQDTTSIGAGAIIVPWAPGISESLKRKWGQPTMEHFAKLAVSEQSAESGASLCMGIIYSPEKKLPIYHDLLLTFNPVPPSTADMLNLGKYQCWSATTVMVTMGRYLPWLTNRFKANGGRIVRRHVKSLREFVDSYDVVVNCTGVDAPDLTQDTKMEPMKGQTMRVSAPWINIFIHPFNVPGEYKPHIYPNVGSVVVGGVKREQNRNMQIEPEVSDTVWRNATNLFPALKPAEVESEWVGLRPHRSPPRVELEHIRYGDKTVKVVHNYGHGATGVCISWGTAIHATELVKQALVPTSRL